MSPRPGPARPHITLRIAASGLALVDEHARAEGKTRSEMLRQLIREALEARDSRKKKR